LGFRVPPYLWEGILLEREMKPSNAIENGTSSHGNPPGSPAPDVQPDRSELPGETTTRILDLELWDLDSQVSFVSRSLPKTLLLPVFFSRATRWGATQNC
jgi:hypothetical protein